MANENGKFWKIVGIIVTLSIVLISYVVANDVSSRARDSSLRDIHVDIRKEMGIADEKMEDSFHAKLEKLGDEIREERRAYVNSQIATTAQVALQAKEIAIVSEQTKHINEKIDIMIQMMEK